MAAPQSILRRKYIDGAPVANDEIRAFASDQPLAEAYQQAVATADQAADLRLEKATIVAELAVRARQIEETKELLERLREEEKTLAGQADALEGEWRGMWSASGLVPLIRMRCWSG
jgi:hypothetical protein